MPNDNRKRLELELKYRWQDQDMLVLIQAIKNQLIPFVGDTFRFSGYVQQEGSPRIKFPFDIIDEWFAALTTDASEIHLGLFSEDNNRRVNLYFYPKEKNLRGWIDAPHQELELVNSLVKQLEGSMSLKTESVPQNLPISRRKYFAKGRLNSKWLDFALQSIRQHFEKEIYFNGQVELETGEKREASGRDIDSWIKEVTANWDAVTEIYCWMDNPERQITLQCDTRREIIDLAVKSLTQSEIAEIEKQLATDLELEIITTKNPYQYRGTQSEYEILTFRNRDFGEALRLAIRQFVGPRLVVVDAVVETEIEAGQEISRPLASFTDLESFFKRVEDSTSYIRVGLCVEGPHGSALGVFAEEKLKRLVINSHLNSNEHAQLALIFKNRLGLKQIDTSKEAESAEPTKKTFADSVWFKVVFPVVTLILGAVLSFVLTPTFLGATAPIYTLRITLPSHRSDEPLAIISETPIQKISLEWTLETKLLFRTVTDLDAPATIRIFRDGLLEMKRFENQTSGVDIELNPGKYAIEVFSPTTKASDRFDVIITSKSP